MLSTGFDLYDSYNSILFIYHQDRFGIKEVFVVPLSQFSDKLIQSKSGYLKKLTHFMSFTKYRSAVSEKVTYSELSVLLINNIFLCFVICRGWYVTWVSGSEFVYLSGSVSGVMCWRQSTRSRLIPPGGEREITINLSFNTSMMCDIQVR